MGKYTCILPESWTVDTLMEPHDSVPYNPDIANVFYRAGYIERWSRGVETICDACRGLPVYEMRGNGLRVCFAALQSAVISQSITPNRQDDQKNVPKEDSFETSLFALIEDNKEITICRMANRLGMSYKTVQRFMEKMKADGRIERHGGKRYGHWIILPLVDKQVTD